MRSITAQPRTLWRRIGDTIRRVIPGDRNQTGHEAFFTDLIAKTGNFSDVKWLGKPIWQNVLDLWTIQETIFEVKPDLLIECGTNRGGGAYFYAQLFDLMGKGKVVSIDVEKMHELTHPRATFLLGSSTAPEVFEQVKGFVDATGGTVMVILDSDHRRPHVAREMELYGPLVSPGSYMLVQDGVMDTLDICRAGFEGPLPAIESFLPRHSEFEVDTERCNRFLISHHPKGWLRRKA